MSLSRFSFTGRRPVIVGKRLRLLIGLANRWHQQDPATEFFAVRSSDFDRAPADLITLFRMCQVAPFIAAASLMSKRGWPVRFMPPRLCSPVGSAGRRKISQQALDVFGLSVVTEKADRGRIHRCPG